MTAYAIGSAQEHLAVRLELLDAEQDLTHYRRLKCCTPISLEHSPALTSMTYIARPPAGTRSASPIAPRTSHAWRPLQPPYSDPPPSPRRGLRAPRPRA
jgi:hypothetical protein